MITTSPDGQWAAIRRGREVALLANGAGPATARIELDTDTADLIIVGPPSVLVIVTRAAADGASVTDHNRSSGGKGPPASLVGGNPVGTNRLVVYQPPYLDAVAQLDLEVAMRIAAVTGPRIVLVSLDGKAVTIVRVAGRALSAQALDTGSPVEFAVGLERNQVLFSLLRKLEAWDAVSGRPLLRMQLQLPPPPRIVGPAHGHLWAMRAGSDDIMVCRLSDGRPFRHHLGAPIDEVVFHPASPLLIIATPRGLVRLHCFAHSLTAIDAPWQPGVPLAQLVVGEDISLLGVPDHGDEPWRVPIGGAGAPAITLDSADAASEPPPTAASKLRAMRERALPDLLEPAPQPTAGRAPPGFRMAGASTIQDDHGEPVSASAAAVPAVHPAARRGVEPARARTWREPLATYAADLIRGADAEVPVVAADTELGQLAQRVALTSAARRALVVLYGLHLVGEPGLAIARLAHALGDWTEALGQGELATLAMLRRRGGKVALRGSVADLIDGASPRAIRVVGGAATTPRPGATRLERAGRSDTAIETELATQLGRIAVIEGGAALALLEARLCGATAVALAAPVARPLPWPRDAGLIVVADPAAPAWVAALPSFTAA